VLEALWEPEIATAAAPVEVEEAGLIRRLGAGDVRAFETLYRRHCGGLHGLALRLTCRRAEAEDLTQEVFLKAWEHRAQFQSADHWRHWLRRVAVNTWLNQVRRRRPLLFDDEQALLDAEARSAPAPPHPGMRLDLERALAALPERLRAVVVLFDIYGLRHEEIGEFLAVKAGSSKVMLHHARRRLREMLR
jgi:RNA polymerase sigma factor (sigma-70 family)